MHLLNRTAKIWESSKKNIKHVFLLLLNYEWKKQLYLFFNANGEIKTIFLYLTIMSRIKKRGEISEPKHPVYSLETLLLGATLKKCARTDIEVF